MPEIGLALLVVVVLLVADPEGLQTILERLRQLAAWLAEERQRHALYHRGGEARGDLTSFVPRDSRDCPSTRPRTGFASLAMTDLHACLPLLADGQRNFVLLSSSRGFT